MHFIAAHFNARHILNREPWGREREKRWARIRSNNVEKSIVPPGAEFVFY